MKNVNETHLKKCIVKNKYEFIDDINKIYENKISFEFENDCFFIIDNSTGEYLDDEDVLEQLSEYYDCSITSYHIAIYDNDYEVYQLWFCYK